MVYFIRKANLTRDPIFGSKQVEWIYHACIGFVDLYLEKDYFIDLSYWCMVNDVHPRLSRMIEKEQYLRCIPDTVDIFIVPFTSLECFVNGYRHNHNLPPIDVDKFLTGCESPTLLWVFDLRIAPPDSSDFKTVQLMLNKSVIFKWKALPKCNHTLTWTASTS